MIADIATDADRLHSIIENLLHLTRLGSGTPARSRAAGPRPGRRARRSPRSRRATRSGRSRSPSDSAARDRRGRRDLHRRCSSRTCSSNAAKYSPPDTPIEVEISEAGDEVVVEVLDRGIGPRRRRLRAPVRAVLPGRAGSRAPPTGSASAWRSASASWMRSVAGSGHGRATVVEPRSGSRCRSPRNRPMPSRLGRARPAGVRRTGRPDSTDRSVAGWPDRRARWMAREARPSRHGSARRHR